MALFVLAICIVYPLTAAHLAQPFCPRVRPAQLENTPASRTCDKLLDTLANSLTGPASVPEGSPGVDATCAKYAETPQVKEVLLSAGLIEQSVDDPSPMLRPMEGVRMMGRSLVVRADDTWGPSF